MGVYITVWATTEAASHVRDVRVATVSTGFNPGVGASQVATLGNKAAPRFGFASTTPPVLFVCSHLSAGSKPDDANEALAGLPRHREQAVVPGAPAASSDGARRALGSLADAFA